MNTSSDSSEEHSSLNPKEKDEIERYADQAMRHSAEALTKHLSAKSLQDVFSQDVPANLVLAIDLWQRCAEKWQKAEDWWQKLTRGRDRNFYKQEARREEQLARLYEKLAQKHEENVKKTHLLDKVYREACRNGSTTSFRAKLDIIGHTGVGKTSLSQRLLDKPCLEQIESTEGIATHCVRSHFNPQNLSTSIWVETDNDANGLVAKFNKEVLMRYESLIPSIDTSVRATTVRKVWTETSSENKTSKRDLTEKTNNTDNSQQKGSIPRDKEVGDKITDSDGNLGTKRQLSCSKRSDVIDTESDDIPTDSNSENEQNDDSVTEIQATTKRPRSKRNIANRNKFEEMSTDTRKQLWDYFQSKRDASSTDVDYSLRLWDYGGHNEFRATHHLFLNIDSTILILLDISKGFKDEIDRDKRKVSGMGVPNTPEEFLHYWLRTIYNQAIKRQQDPNIALVLTHKDMIEAPNIDQYINDFITNVKKSIKGSNYCDYITNNNIFVIDNKNSDSSGFLELRSQIFKLCTNQKSWGLERPTRWLKLEADILANATKQCIRYLPLSDVKKLAKTYGVLEKELYSFLHFHHTLGDFVYYDESGLRDAVITDPQWLADKFKTLITAHEFIDIRTIAPTVAAKLKQGRVSFDLLQKLLEERDVYFLLQLFEKFNLLLPLGPTSHQYVIPCMLPPIVHSLYETEPFKSMMLAYNSEHRLGNGLPIGTFHKLLSECSKVKDWKICSNDHLSYTDASFEIASNVRLALTLLKGTQIRASIFFSRDAVQDMNSLLQVRKVIEQKMLKFDIPRSYNFHILCPYWNVENSETCLIRLYEKTHGRKIRIHSRDRICYRHQKTLHDNYFPEIEADEKQTKENEMQLRSANPELVLGKDDLDNGHKKLELKSPISLRDIISKDIGDITNVEEWGPCPMTMIKNHKEYVGTVCNGKPRILQPSGSDVSLEIPQGSTGVYVMGVHTDVSKFKNDIAKEECFVSPVVQIEHSESNKELKCHTIRIPHCLHSRSLLDLIRVRRGKPTCTVPFEEIPSIDEIHSTEYYYFLDENYITISSTEFSDFICTTCNSTCQGIIKLFLFGKLNAWIRKNVTTVQMKSFLCSPLFLIEDFREHLVKVQKTYELVPLGERVVDMESVNFNPHLSHMTIKMSPAITELNSWKPIYDDGSWNTKQACFVQEKAMSRAMVLDGCHQCRSPDHKEAMVADIVTNGICSDFHGIFDLVVHPVEAGSHEKEAEGNLRTQLFFTIRGESPVKHDEKYGEPSQAVQKAEAIYPMDKRSKLELQMDTQLQQIAERLTDRTDIFCLGLKLNLKRYKIEAIFKDYPTSITSVAEEVLRLWLKGQDNLDEASIALGRALVQSNLNLIAREILDYPPKPTESESDVRLTRRQRRRTSKCNVA